MRQIKNTILLVTNVVPFVGIFYYFIPGFSHIGTSGIGSQPNMGFLCIVLFLIAFFTAVQLTPKKSQEAVDTQKEQISPYTGEKFDPKWGMKR